MNHALTAWLNLWVWWLPEPDYNRIWYEKTLRSNVLPYVTGV